ncbi:MAG: Uma2 family endonuclease [Planctomycetaceae bacterium]|nr:Uma2 family endonuclease [Planctomycetaceae bacterium]
MSTVAANPETTPAANLEITPDDLLKMPDGERYELVDGRLVERNVSFRSSYIGTRLSHLILLSFGEDPPGWVVSADCGYQCFADKPKLVRRPDISFIRLGRLPGEQLSQGLVRIAPDLAVEVLSPNDLDYETDFKVEEYLRAGVRLVWVVNPESRTILIYRADGSIQGLREPDELSGEDTLPGFRCRVSALFTMPPSA